MVHPGLPPRKDLREPQCALQIPPLRYAPVGMTRGEGWLRLEWLRDGEKPQVPPLRYPGFPVETRGFDDLHAALFKESRTRGRR